MTGTNNHKFPSSWTYTVIPISKWPKVSALYESAINSFTGLESVCRVSTITVLYTYSFIFHFYGFPEPVNFPSCLVLRSCCLYERSVHILFYCIFWGTTNCALVVVYDLCSFTWCETWVASLLVHVIKHYTCVKLLRFFLYRQTVYIVYTILYEVFFLNSFSKVYIGDLLLFHCSLIY